MMECKNRIQIKQTHFPPAQLINLGPLTCQGKLPPEHPFGSASWSVLLHSFKGNAEFARILRHFPGEDFFGVSELQQNKFALPVVSRCKGRSYPQKKGTNLGVFSCMPGHYPGVKAQVVI